MVGGNVHDGNCLDVRMLTRRVEIMEGDHKEIKLEVKSSNDAVISLGAVMENLNTTLKNINDEIKEGKKESKELANIVKGVQIDTVVNTDNRRKAEGYRKGIIIGLLVAILGGAFTSALGTVIGERSNPEPQTIERPVTE